MGFVITATLIEPCAEVAMQPARPLVRRPFEAAIRQGKAAEVALDFLLETKDGGLHQLALARTRALIDALGYEHDDAE